MSLGSLEIGGLAWRKARRSANNGACVELAAANGQILIRDSQDQNGPVMKYSECSWDLFIANAKMGQFDPGSL